MAIMAHYCHRILQNENQIEELSIVFLSIYSMPCSFIKIQDIKFKWPVLRNLLINGNLEYFKNVF